MNRCLLGTRRGAIDPHVPRDQIGLGGRMGPLVLGHQPARARVRAVIEQEPVNVLIPRILVPGDIFEPLVVDLICDVWLLFGEQLEQSLAARSGDYFFIPGGVPHAPFNASDAPCTFVVAHSASDDQEGIVMRPELDVVPARVPA